jgi:hypothetical protein
VEQLACIMELLGTPPDDLINQATRRRLFFGEYYFLTRAIHHRHHFFAVTHRLERRSALHYEFERPQTQARIEDIVAVAEVQ